MKTIFAGVLTASVAMLLAAGAAHAEQERFALSESWKAECGSCHVAYPPPLLAADAWNAIFDGLEDHFGSDASVDAATASVLRAYATSNAGRAVPDAPLRITRTRWFRHEHDEIGSATWTSPAIGSPSNCAACHTGADQGDYSEGRIRIPRKETNR